MKVLLTTAGLETQEIQDRFVALVDKDMIAVKALFIPTAAMDAGAISVLPKCMNDLLKCGIRSENIKVYDMHSGMDIEELRCFDIVYLCGGSAQYLLQRIKETEFQKSLATYIEEEGVVLGVSAGSIIFANNLTGNLGLLDTKLNVHCTVGEKSGKITLPLKTEISLANEQAIVITTFPEGLEIIGR